MKFLSWKITIATAACLVLYPIFGGGVENAAGEDKSAREKRDSADWLGPLESHYTLGPENDPFRPFLDKKEIASRDRKKDQRPLTPLEKVEVSQLQLVGILWYPGKPNNARAMVELPDGKGYLLQEGSRVGRNSGEVVRILPHRVVVQEKVVDVLGNTKKKKITLKVRTDEENKNN